jgi:cell division protease FtsH
LLNKETLELEQIKELIEQGTIDGEAVTIDEHINDKDRQVVIESTTDESESVKVNIQSQSNEDQANKFDFDKSEDVEEELNGEEPKDTKDTDKKE